MKKLIGLVSPWLKPALIGGGLLLIAACVALYYKADAAEERAKAATSALKDSENANAVLRSQTTAATAVAETLREEREKDRAVARQNVQGIRNAPIDQNSVVPGVLPAAIGGLRDSARK